MKELILQYINGHKKDKLTTSYIGKQFGLSTTEAYTFLFELYNENKIKKYPPFDKFRDFVCNWSKI